MKNRIQSVDIFRGITITAMILVNTPGNWSYVYKPLLHSDWHGLTPTDLIFPFFLFIVGISISFAYKNSKNENSTYKKITFRSLKLIGLGLFLNIFIPYFPFYSDLVSVRIPGVLQRIGIVFFVSSLLFLNFNWKTLLSILITILISYWLFTSLVPLPNGESPVFERDYNNWANYIDIQVLPNHTWKNDYDPEGIISTLTSLATCLIGILLGKILQLNSNNKLNLLLAFGMILLILGYVWSIWYPINKALWTSTFVLITTGYGTLFLVVFYYLSDVKHIKYGSIFKHTGTNAISIYFLSSLISKIFTLTKVNNEQSIHSYIYTNFYLNVIHNNELASLLYAISVVLFYLFIAYIMYLKNWIIKV